MANAGGRLRGIVRHDYVELLGRGPGLTYTDQTGRKTRTRGLVLAVTGDNLTKLRLGLFVLCGVDQADAATDSVQPLRTGLEPIKKVLPLAEGRSGRLFDLCYGV